MKNLFTTLFFLLITSLFWNATANIIYVDSASTGGDGTTWATAYNDLQDALADYDAGDTILVAQGAYKPGIDPWATFGIDKDLVLIGGFGPGGIGYDPAVYETILTGDLNGDDVPGDFETGRIDNTSAIVTIGPDVSNATLIYGFTIRNGHADGGPTVGGAIFSSGAPVIRRCRFEQNYALYTGGAVFSSLSFNAIVQMDSCVFFNNQAATGGAVGFTSDSNAVLQMDDCLFENNLAEAQGGGVSVWEAGFVIRNCDFTNNQTGSSVSQGSSRGGGIVITNPENGLIDSCYFSGNMARDLGGGLFVRSAAAFQDASLSISHCHFEENSTELSGGGVFMIPYGDSGTFSLMDCDFTQNGSGLGGGLSLAVNAASDNAQLSVENCTFSGNRAITEDGGGLRGLFAGTNTHLEIQNCSFTKNAAEAWGGGASLLDLLGGSGNVIVQNCLFEKDSSNWIGGGMTIGGNGSFGFEVANCQFLENDAAEYAGGLEIYSQSTPKTISVEDCHFEGNTAGDLGGGIGLDVSEPGLEAVVRNCRLHENDSPAGSAIGADPSYTLTTEWTQEASIRIENCLMTNHPGEGGVVSNRKTGHMQLLNCTVADNATGGIALDSGAVVSIQNTALYNLPHSEYTPLVADVIMISNGGNLVSDASLNAILLPLLDKPETNPMFENDYYPSEGSPLVNGGVNEGVTAEFDLAGDPRIQYNIVDIGAYESLLTATDEPIFARIQVFPNPASDLLNIEWPEFPFEPVELSIFDAQGRLVIHAVQFTGKEVDVEKLPAGVYFLQANMGEFFYRSRFSKN